MNGYLEQNMEEDIRKQRGNRRKRFVIILVIAACLAVAASIVIIYYFHNRLFRGYTVSSEIKRNDSNTVQYLSYGDNLLKYSRDGASCLDQSGKEVWNGGYEMEQPQADVCGKYAVVADVNGKELYVYNGEDSGTKIETNLPIVKARVAEQGVVAVLLQDKASNVINIYNPYSSATPLLVEIPTNVDGDGYPVDFDISPDGNSLVSTYLSIKDGNMDNKVNFYNFTDVGKDKNRLVGTKDFGKESVMHIQFVDEDQVVIMHQDGFSLYSNMKEPEETFGQKFQDKIRTLVASEDGIGVVTYNEKSKKKKLQLFDTSGREKLNMPISYDYDKAFIGRNEIVFYSSNSIRIMRENGKEKANLRPKKNVQWLFSGNSDDSYYLINESTIQEINLSGGSE